MHAVVLQAAWTVREMVVSTKWRSEVSATKGLVGRPEMRKPAAAGTEAAKKVLGYMFQVVKVGAAIIQMARMAAMGVCT